MSGKKVEGEKLRRVISFIKEGESAKGACRKANVNRSSYYRWLSKIKDYCFTNSIEPSWDNVSKVIEKAIKDKSRKPNHFAREMSLSTKDRIIFLATSGDYKSGASVAKKLREEGLRVSEKKVIEVLRDEGLYNKMKKGEL